MNRVIDILKAVVNTLQHIKMESTKENLNYMVGSINALESLILDLERINKEENVEDSDGTI